MAGSRHWPTGRATKNAVGVLMLMIITTFSLRHLPHQLDALRLRSRTLPEDEFDFDFDDEWQLGADPDSPAPAAN
jgi:hypothetical protein